jgi:hypothetical protein
VKAPIVELELVVHRLLRPLQMRRREQLAIPVRQVVERRLGNAAVLLMVARVHRARVVLVPLGR